MVARGHGARVFKGKTHLVSAHHPLGVPRRGIGKTRERQYRGLAFLAVLVVLSSLGAMPAKAACSTPNNVALTLNLPDYPFWRSVAGQMQQCGNVAAEFGFDAAVVEPDPANPDRNLGSMVGISNASLYRLMQQNLLRPLDDLVEKYGVLLNPRQLIRVDGKVMAIAVAANMRVLMVHRELLVQENIETPQTWDEVLAAAGKLKGSQLYEAPLTLAFRPGWNLTQEFIDLFIGSGGSLLDENSRPAISGETGLAVLARLKEMTQFLPKDYSERDSARVLNDLMRFTAPMAVTWVTNAGPLDNPAVSRVSGKMQVLPAPSITKGGKPAATLWWDGFAIPVSATMEEAEAAFLTALEGLDADMLAEHGQEAFWLIDDYEPGRLTKDVLAAIDTQDESRRVEPYRDSRELNLLRRALNNQIEAFIAGEKEAADALAGAESDYLKAARELGIAGL